MGGRIRVGFGEEAGLERGVVGERGWREGSRGVDLSWMELRFGWVCVMWWHFVERDVFCM